VIHKLLLLPLFVVLTGCVAVPPSSTKRSVVFDEEPFRPYASKGTAIVSGQAFLKTVGGDVKLGAGCEVKLVPATPYTDEVHESGRRGIRLEAPDPRYAKYRRTTIADAGGNFTFKEIPAGSYYVATTITWQYPTKSGLRTTGGTIDLKIFVLEGEDKRVVLTRTD
jgi:hypothetical protein